MSWALITGAAARGGAAIARALHNRGMNVVVHHSRRSEGEAAQLATNLNKTRPGSARLWCADFDETEFELPVWFSTGDITVCVCNASRWVSSRLENLEQGRADWDIHVGAHARILASLEPSLQAVVSVTDVHAERPAKGYVWYTAAKAALQALTLALSIEWAPRIRCNVVQPGTLPWPEGWADSSRQAEILNTIPMQRTGVFEELAEVVGWLALDASYVTGQVLVVDGGRTRWLR
jgi:pteridine reductase